MARSDGRRLEPDRVEHLDPGRRDARAQVLPAARRRDPSRARAPRGPWRGLLACRAGVGGHPDSPSPGQGDGACRAVSVRAGRRRRVGARGRGLSRRACTGRLRRDTARGRCHAGGDGGRAASLARHDIRDHDRRRRCGGPGGAASTFAAGCGASRPSPERLLSSSTPFVSPRWSDCAPWPGSKALRSRVFTATFT